MDARYAPLSLKITVNVTREEAEIKSKHSPVTEPNREKTAPTRTEPGASSTIRQGSASFFTPLKVPIRAVGGLDTDAALMLEDNGATENLVMHKIAEKLGLAKRPNMVFLKVINRRKYRQLETFIYQLEVVDTGQAGHQIEAIGVDSITVVGHVRGGILSFRAPDFRSSLWENSQ